MVTVININTVVVFDAVPAVCIDGLAVLKILVVGDVVEVFIVIIAAVGRGLDVIGLVVDPLSFSTRPYASSLMSTSLLRLNWP